MCPRPSLTDRLPFLSSALVLLALLFCCEAPARARIIYVDRDRTTTDIDGHTWASAFRSVQQGLNAAAAGDEVWVAEGVYMERLNMVVGVGLYGGFSGTETTREGRDIAAHVSEVNANLEGRAVTVPAGAGPDTVIDGLTLRKGYVTNIGALILCYGASPTIRNNNLIESGGLMGGGVFGGSYNRTPQGGGIACRDSSPVIENNTFRYLTAVNGAAIYCQAAHPTINGNTFEGGAAEAGSSIYMDSSSPVIVGNSFSGPRALDNDSGGIIHCRNGSAPRIAGNRIENGVGGGFGGAILCIGSSPTIENNLIRGNRTTGTTGHGGGGIACLDASAPLIANNILAANQAGRDSGGGLYCGNGSAPRVIGNTFVMNEAHSGGAVFIAPSAAPVFTNNLIAYNASGIYALAPVNLRHNNVYGNWRGDYTGSFDPGASDGNLSVDPRMANAARGDYHLEPDSPCRDAGDPEAVTGAMLDMDGQPRAQGSAPDIGADESDGTLWGVPNRIIRVRPGGSDDNDGSSWDLAMRSPVAAAAQAIGQDEVWVAAGTYAGTVTLRRGARLYGGFSGGETARDQRDWAANPTVLDAGGAAYAVLVTEGPWWGGTVDGFTIRGAKVDPIDKYGAGIWCLQSTAVRHCDIRDNEAPGVQLGTDGLLEDCVVRDNTGAGLVGNVVSTFGTYFVTARRNLITRNADGGVQMTAGLGIVEGNRIVANRRPRGTGGGILASNGSIVRNNIIVGNSAYLGGGLALVDINKSTACNNTIVGNTARYAGGVYAATEITSTVVNNLVAFNSSGLLGPGAANSHHNNVFGNTDGDFQGSTDPAANLSVDPQFAGRTHGDLRLLPNSPCVDAGEAGSFPVGTLDADGRTRIQGVALDIGALESDGQPVDSVPYIVRVRSDGDDAHDGTDWDRAKRSVTAAVSAVSGQGGGEVWVADGIFAGGFRLGPFTTLLGGFRGTEQDPDERDGAAVTVLEGPADAAVVHLDGGTEARVDGFTIRGGAIGLLAENSNAPLTRLIVTGNRMGVSLGSGRYFLEDCDLAGNGGALTATRSTLSVNRCRVTDNVAPAGSYTFGGLSATESSVTVTDSAFMRNSPSGAGFTNCDTSLIRCTIVENIGGGLFAGMGDLYEPLPFSVRIAIADCHVARNRGETFGGMALGVPSTITNCRVERNVASTYSATGADGLVMRSGTLSNSVILNNGLPSRSIGLYMEGTVTMVNNTIAGHFRGVYSKAQLTMVNNILAGNDTGFRTGYTGAVLRNNAFWNRVAQVSGMLDPTGANGNFVADPRLAGHRAGNVHIQPDSPCVNAGDSSVAQPGATDMDGQPRIQGERVDIGADESDGTAYSIGPLVFHLRTDGDDLNDGLTWATALRTLTMARYLAEPGEEVWVAAGEYAQATALTLKEGVGLYGGFTGDETDRTGRDVAASATILSGGPSGPVVLAPAGITTATVLDGFTVRNGKGSYIESALWGGGILCDGGAPTITRNTITANSADNGGGIAVRNAAPVLRDNIIRENTGTTGGLYLFNAPARIIGNTISNNPGNGMYCSNSSAAEITDNVFAGNTGSGLVCMGSAALITGNSFTSNMGTDGAGLRVIGGAPTIRGNVFTQNGDGTINRGGGLYLDYSTALVEGNTLRSNRAQAGGGAVVRGGYAILRGNLFEGNTATEGGGLYIMATNAEIAGNAFTANEATGPGGAISNGSYSSAVLRNNRITDNRSLSGAGGGLHLTSFSGRIEGNLIARNSAHTHGAAKVSGNQCHFRNNTVVENTAEVAGEPTVMLNTHGLVYSNIIAFNHSGIGTNDLYPSFLNNCVFGNGAADYTGVADPTGTIGNIRSDPRFVNRLGDDYHLAPDSPCIDAGRDSVVLPEELDLDGQPRRQGAHVDIGAFETRPADPAALADAIRALRLAAGLDAASGEDMARLDVLADGETPAGISLTDAARLVRRALGWDAVP